MADWQRLKNSIEVFFNLREPPNVPAHGWSYFDHMVAVYVTLNIDDPRADAVIAKARDRPYGLKWGDIFLLENTILALQTDATICRNAWIQRERFREIAGPEMYARYVDSGMPRETDTPAKVQLLRADLARVLDFLHWYYVLIPIREAKRKSLTVFCIVMVAIYTAVLLLLLFYLRAHNHAFSAMACCVIFFGIVGGFVSSQRRMQSIPVDGDPLIGVFGLDNAGYYLWLSPLLGSIFAAVLTMMFVGGILQGTVFPQFGTLVSDLTTGHSMFHLAGLSLPVGPADYAKLFIWSFMAGFAERLVPDSLDRLASKLDPGKQAPTGSAGAPPPPPPPPPPGGGAGGGTSVQGTETPLGKETLHNAMHTGEVMPPRAALEGHGAGEEPEGG